MFSKERILTAIARMEWTLPMRIGELIHYLWLESSHPGSDFYFTNSQKEEMMAINKNHSAPLTVLERRCHFGSSELVLADWEKGVAAGEYWVYYMPEIEDKVALQRFIAGTGEIKARLRSSVDYSSHHSNYVRNHIEGPNVH